MNITLKEMIYTIMDKKTLSVRMIAENIDISAPTLTNFLNDKSEPKIGTIYKFLVYLFGEDTHDFKNAWIEYAKDAESIQNIRTLSLNAQLVQQKEIVERCMVILRNSTSTKDKEFMRIRDLVSSIYAQEVTSEEGLERLHSQNPKSSEMKAYKLLTLGAVYLLFLGDLKTSYRWLTEAEPALDTIEDQAFKSTLKANLYNYLSIIHQKLDTSDKCVEYAKRSKESSIFPAIKGHNDMNIGMFYIFKDYEKAKHFYEQSLNISGVWDISFMFVNAKETLNLLHIYWHRFENVDYEYLSPLYQAYLLNQQGLYKEAREKLDETLSSLDMENDPEMMSLVGIITEDDTLLLKALTKMLQRNDILFTPLPIKKLLELGIKQEYIDVVVDGFRPNRDFIYIGH